MLLSPPADGGQVAGQPYHAYAHIADGGQHPARRGAQQLHIRVFWRWSPAAAARFGAAYGDDAHEYDHDYHNRARCGPSMLTRLLSPSMTVAQASTPMANGADYAGNAEMLLHRRARRRHHNYEAEVNGYRGEIVIRPAQPFAAVVYVYVLQAF